MSGILSELELRRLAGSLSLEQKVRLLTGADFWALHPEPDIGLRRIVMSDGPAGVRGESFDERQPSANVPSPTALAATWDVARVEAIGALLAAEARRKGVDVLLAPTVNLHRTPYGGRHFECFSEDPLLTGAIGSAYVRGLQGAGVGACVKHFTGNDSETQRMTVDVRIDDRTLHEMYLAPFDAIVREAGAWTVMAAYNGVNGHSMTQSPLLREILHDQWGFDGVVVSDWTAARSTQGTALAALDLAMPGPAEVFGPWGAELITAVRDGKVAEDLIDDKVVRVLRLAARVGALASVPVASPERPQPDRADAAIGPEQISTELRSAAAASFVLARNDSDLLPLDPGTLRRVAVIGPNAALARTMGGGSATVFPAYTVSPLDGMNAAGSPLDGLNAAGSPLDGLNAAGGFAVEYAPGVFPHGRVQVAGAPWLQSPDGSGKPGAEVRFFDLEGRPAGSEMRASTAFTWLGGFGPDHPAGSVGRLEVHAVITATMAGAYTFGVSGLGRHRLLVRGEPVLETDLEMPESSDVAELMMSPPQRTVPVVLAEGESVPVVCEYDVTSSPLGGFAAFLQLNLEPPHGTDDEEIAAAARLAAGCDAAVVVVGTTAQTESEGFDRTTLALPGRQDDLVRAVCAANPATIAVVNSGAPVLLPWSQDVPAVLLTWFGGQEYGAALADVLLGYDEPGGRLPVTWPASEAGLPSVTPADGVLTYDEGLFIGYRAPGRSALFPFGSGSGYTTWAYESLTVAGTTASVSVRNTGRRAGREVVQVYLSRPGSAVSRPARWLAGFASVTAAPGERVAVGIAIPERAFQHWSEGGWHTEPGEFTMHAGSSSAVLPLTAAIAPAT